MNIRTRAAAFTLAVCATPAFADLTADDVLSAMTTQLSAFDLLDVSVPVSYTHLTLPTILLV